MTWGFVWLMLVLKIPIAMLLYLVWWAIHQDGDPEDPVGGEGGTKVRPPHRGGGRRGRFPRRRGPHGDPVPPAPERVRTTVVRSPDAEPR
jgi:hypothetical protein